MQLCICPFFARQQLKPFADCLIITYVLFRAVIDEMFSNGGGFPSGESSIMKNLIGDANFVTGKMFSFGKFVGLLSPDGYNINKDQAYFDKVSEANVDPTEQLYSNKILGPVNRIDTTKARDAGITFDQKISLVC